MLLFEHFFALSSHAILAFSQAALVVGILVVASTGDAKAAARPTATTTGRAYPNYFADTAVFLGSRGQQRSDEPTVGGAYHVLALNLLSVLSHLEKVQELPVDVQTNIARRVDSYLMIARAAKDETIVATLASTAMEDQAKAIRQGGDTMDPRWAAPAIAAPTSPNNINTFMASSLPGPVTVSRYPAPVLYLGSRFTNYSSFLNSIDSAKMP